MRGRRYLEIEAKKLLSEWPKAKAGIEFFVALGRRLFRSPLGRMLWSLGFAAVTAVSYVYAADRYLSDIKEAGSARRLAGERELKLLQMQAIGDAVDLCLATLRDDASRAKYCDRAAMLYDRAAGGAFWTQQESRSVRESGAYGLMKLDAAHMLRYLETTKAPKTHTAAEAEKWLVLFFTSWSLQAFALFAVLSLIALPQLPVWTKRH